MKISRFIPAVLVLYSVAAAWTVCIDPGHGGSDPGASGSWYLEKDANLDVALGVLGILNGVPGCEWVGMTRTGDQTVSLAGRVAYANQNGFDRFMSIHENAFNTQTQGTETFCYSLDPGTQGYQLASDVQSGILWAHGYTDRGVKDGSWIYVVANTSMPAILGEGSFIDYDASWNESYRYYTNWEDHIGRQAYAYAQAICVHMGSTPPPYDPGDIVVDNLSSGFSVNSEAQWNTGSYGNPWGEDYRWSSAVNQADWARWTPELPEPGWYEVSVWYTQGGNRAPDAVYTVTHCGGETQYIVDQTQNGGQWNLLGGFPFVEGTAGYVTLYEAGASDDRVVVADAVKFELSSTGVSSDAFQPVPSGCRLAAGPNPASSFTITLDVSRDTEMALEVFELSGRLVETLSGGTLLPGEHTFAWDPADLPAGVYLVRAHSAHWNATERVVLVR